MTKRKLESHVPVSLLRSIYTPQCIGMLRSYVMIMYNVSFAYCDSTQFRGYNYTTLFPIEQFQ